MPELAHLQIKVDSTGVVTGTQHLHQLAVQGKKAETSTTGLATSFRGLIAPIAGVVSVAAGFRKFVEINREFDKLQAGLVTATGSATNAKQAFTELQKIAAKTPNSVRETVDAFNKLVNYGLDPSERSMMSFGNTSAAMGKTLTQLIEAVADAATGEFERLKEFGIKARNQGQTISYTFRGVTTTVKNSSQEIQDYLRKLGETEFAGAMAERMKTLDGALSNLGDTWDRVWREMGESNIGDVFKSAVDTAQEALKGLIGFMNSDEMARGVLAIRKVAIDLAYALDKAGGVKSFLLGLTPIGGAFGIGKHAVGAGATGAVAIPAGAPGSPEWTRKQAMADLDREYLRRSMAAATPTGGAVDLGQYAKGGGGSSAAKKKGAAGGIEFFKFWGETSLATTELREQLRDLEDGILSDAETFRREFAAKAKGVFELQEEGLIGGGKADELLSGYHDQLERQLKMLEDEKQREREALLDGLRTEEEDLKHSYDLRLAAIRDAVARGVVFEEEGADLVARIRQKQTDDEQAKNMALVRASTDAAEALAGNIAAFAKAGWGEQSAAYKRAFEMQKTFAVASATVAMWSSIAEGVRMGIPEGIPKMLLGASEGARVLAMISSTNYAGAYDAGGMIPAGKVGLVGERRPELVRGPAQVVGGAATAQMLGGAGGLTVVFAPDENTARMYANSSHNENAFLVFAQKNRTTLRRLLL